MSRRSTHGRGVAVALAALAGCSSPSPYGSSSTVFTGTVVDAAGRPIPGARVRLQANAASTVTTASGSFRLRAPSAQPSGVVTAWKDGYVNGGAKLAAGRTDYHVVLSAIPDGDDRGYAWASPRRAPRAVGEPGDARAPCEHCHPDIVSEWGSSAHAGSAQNPLFLAVYEGVDRDGRPTGGPAYRLDFREAMGNCAACHLPAMALEAPFGSDAAAARGVAADGVSCDPCHKIVDAAIDDTGGRPGVLSYRFARPPPGKDVFFGQLDDVVAGPDSFSPLYRESRYCAPCHHGTFWKVRAYSEFEEWAKSSYAKRHVECQHCHMKPRSGPRRFALEKEGGVVRDADTLSSHAQYGLSDDVFMRSSVTLSTRADAAGEQIRVRVAIRNSGAGHHVPTGSPMRNMLLVVDARDARGEQLALVRGERVPEWAGQGSPARGDYAGLPGKGFAKVLADLVEYPADRRQGRRFSRVLPAPYWRPAVVVSDTRIPAEATDESEYVFTRAGRSGPVTVRTRLVYRRTFRSWGSLNRVKGSDLELASATRTVAW